MLYHPKLHYTILWDAENRMTHGLSVCTAELYYSSKITSSLACLQHPSWWWPRLWGLFWLHTELAIQRTVNSVTLKSLSWVWVSVLNSTPCKQGLDSFCLHALLYVCLHWSSPANLFDLGGLSFCKLENVSAYSLLQDTADDIDKITSHADFCETPLMILLHLENWPLTLLYSTYFKNRFQAIKEPFYHFQWQLSFFHNLGCGILSKTFEKNIYICIHIE